MNDDATNRLMLLLQNIAEQTDPLNMLLLADQPAPLLERLRNTESLQEGQFEGLTTAAVAAHPRIPGDRRWSLVCVLEPAIDKPSLIRLLAGIRDLHADRVIHVNSNSDWSLADSLALGFSQRDEPANPQLNPEPQNKPAWQIFEFDLHNYKPAPDWLNAKNWANPERWGKHRW